MSDACRRGSLRNKSTTTLGPPGAFNSLAVPATSIIAMNPGHSCAGQPSSSRLTASGPSTTGARFEAFLWRSLDSAGHQRKAPATKNSGGGT